MMDKDNINKLTEDAINSIEGISRASAGEMFGNKVLNRISERENRSRMKKFSSGSGWKIVLVFAALIIINLFTLIKYTGLENKEYEQNLYSFIKEYSLINQTYNY
ncbi:MAG: hypothetical protein ACHQJ4_01380 [Ignavibacteria bacterium]